MTQRNRPQSERIKDLAEEIKSVPLEKWLALDETKLSIILAWAYGARVQPETIEKLCEGG